MKIGDMTVPIESWAIAFGDESLKTSSDVPYGVTSIYLNLPHWISDGRYRVAELLWLAGECFERTILTTRSHGLIHSQ